MPSVDRNIWIDAPAEKVFRFVADYRNTTRYQRHFSRFQPVDSQAWGLGMTVDARGRFRGLPVHARLTITEFVENRRISSRSVAGLKSSAQWSFADEDGGTRVRFVASYDWPVPVLSGAMRRTIERSIVAMTESSLRELKRLLE